ncbi:MAG: sulfotransferase [Candidatus Omnitrophica bacterium]|nr:sulfotransferase [Candidatus Omnitrophota bacterium]
MNDGKIQSVTEMIDYQRIMDQLLELPSCALLTTGRAGTDFLQSLLDSHPQVLTFNGYVPYYNFWKESRCAASKEFDLNDFLDEFIGHFIERFKSKYDYSERKDQLGEKYDQTIDIDLQKFKFEVSSLLKGRELNSRNTLIAIYAAYNICIGQSLEGKSIFFHHNHDLDGIDLYLNDFPKSQFIIMTRDPRSNFVSGIENWRIYDETKDRGLHLNGYIKRILADADLILPYSKKYTAIKIEDLGEKKLLEGLCQWLGIRYHECLNKSTWAGLSWHGDRVSVKKNDDEGLSKEMLINNWEERLSFLDKYILNFIMAERLKHYGYSFREITLFDKVIMPFAILLPLRYELRFFSFKYIFNKISSKQYRILASNICCYFLRIGLFLKYYFRVLIGRKFLHPFLK